MKKIKYLLILILIVTNAYTTIIPTFGYGQKYQDPKIDDKSIWNWHDFGIVSGIFGGAALLVFGGGAALLWYQSEFIDIPFRRFDSDNVISVSISQQYTQQLIEEYAQQFSSANISNLDSDGRYEDFMARVKYTFDKDALYFITQHHDGSHSLETDSLYHISTYLNLKDFAPYSTIAKFVNFIKSRVLSPYTKLEIIATLQPDIDNITFYSKDVTEYTVSHDGKKIKLLGLKNFTPNYFDNVRNKLIFTHKNGKFYAMRQGADTHMIRIDPSVHNVFYTLYPNHQSGNPYHMRTNYAMSLF